LGRADGKTDAGNHAGSYPKTHFTPLSLQNSDREAGLANQFSEAGLRLTFNIGSKEKKLIFCGKNLSLFPKLKFRRSLNKTAA
jgi:hypothetical protein